MNATPTNPPLSLHLGLASGPSLLHPPRGQVWWTYPDGVLGLGDGARSYRLDSATVTITREAKPWAPEAAGRVFRDYQLLFRYTAAGLRAIATMGERSRHLEGPDGSVLIRDGDEWTRAATPSGDAQPLDEALPCNPWGVRWSRDGRRIAIGDECGATHFIDVATGRQVAHREDALPIDGDGGLLYEDGRLEAGATRWTGIREATAAFDGRLLAGPGGVVWDLTTGRRLFDVPVVPLGTVVPGERWLLVPWDTGEGLWLDPLTGLTVPGPQIDDDDLPEPDAPQTKGDGWSLDRAGLHVDGWPVFDLPVTAGARVGSRVWAWSDDGLLVAVPVV